MANLRIISVDVIDSTDITVVFTEPLTKNLITANVSIVSQSANVPDSAVLKLYISGSTLKITCQPLTELAVYMLQFQSVPGYPFQSLNGDATLLSDNVSGKYSITGPMAADNPFIQYFSKFYNGSIYDAMQNPNSVVSKYINALALNFSRALHDIQQLGNENYLELDIVDEQHTRGPGPFDYLYQGGAYEVSRVGFGPTNASASNTFVFADFPDYPVTLQRQIITETLKPNSVDLEGVFNINSFTLNLNNNPVTRVDSVSFLLNTATPNYTYNIPVLGYQIQNSRYDQDYASSYLGLSTSQIRLSENILSDPLFSIDNIISVTVQYEYKDLGIVVDPTSVVVDTVLQSTREVLPPIINVFNLQHAPITDSNGDVETFGGITFTDPNQSTPGDLHPAFINEIPFRLNALPSTPGQYSVNYAAGTVYVYGADLNNDGTGAYPPLATYSYLFTYQSEIDYVYDTDLSDIVALGPGNLTGNAANVDFNYQQVLIPGVDYNAEVHIEDLNEYVGNNLTALNILTTQNSPITNVFRILNETSGEIYGINRWEDNKVFFTYNTPPRIISQVGEQVSFYLQTNELLFINTTLTNTNNIRAFKIFFDNNTIVAGTEDTIGSSINSSVVFSNGNVFVNEIWWDAGLSETSNISRLTIVGEYMIDYANGVAYVAVSNTQQASIGTVSYRYSEIDPNNSHIISVDDLYYRISPLLPKNAEFQYVSFEDDSVLAGGLNPSDEQYLNANSTDPYFLLNGNVGTFIGSSFVAGVTYQIKFIRSVYAYDDLMYNTNPINFASVSTSSGFNISVGSINKQAYETVQFDGYNYYVALNENIPYLSSYITFNFNVVRSSDGATLTVASIVPTSPTNPFTLVLSDTNSPQAGNLVSVKYSFTINNVSRVVVDYNKGNYYIDYTYVADEIVVSYEYGDNVIDFRGSETVSTNDTYYVSYKAGALRDALLQNFGTLVNIPLLANVDLNFDRQRYREALQAALGSFVQGPTIPAIKNIGKVISHIEPELVESAFQSWTLGSSLLNPEPIETTGSFQLVPVKFGSGPLINASGQTITFPFTSNIRLEEGTFETWILPQWNGLDNNSDLTFTITRNGIAVDPTLLPLIFIGQQGDHPTSNIFSINKQSYSPGTPDMNMNGVFIYYDKDVSGDFSRWYVQVIDGYYLPTNMTSSYKIVIKTTGNIYDNTITQNDGYLSTTTGTNSITLNIKPTTVTSDNGVTHGVTFVSDPQLYVLDFGLKHDRSRFSIYKDASGYLNFRVIDKNKKIYSISSDISAWQNNQLHMIATSWKLNTINNQDEMHLFIDGFEVPNIIKYGQRLNIPDGYTDFRTVYPEVFVGQVNYDIVASTDLTTTQGSNIVSSSINFSAYNIYVGNTIFIDEVGFNTAGYTIENINGQTLTLNAPMPASLPGDGRYSVNRTTFQVSSEINIYPNIMVTTIHTGSTTENEIPGVRALNPAYSISQDANYNNILTISNDVFKGDTILLRTLGLNFRDVKKRYYVWSDRRESVLMTQLPPPISLDEVDITKIIMPNTLIGSTGGFVNTSVSQPTNSQSGRSLTAVLSGNNINFSLPVTVTVDGYNYYFNHVVDTISFTNYGSLDFPDKYLSISSITVVASPSAPNKNAGTIEVREKYSMTHSENSGLVPVVRYSYVIGAGTTLYNDSPTSVRDDSNNFSALDVGNILFISSPGVVDGYCVAGFYLITGISADLSSLTIQSTVEAGRQPLPNFTDGYYQVLKITDYRSGLQNGFFVLEAAGLPGQRYFLSSGTYEFDYSTYASIKFDPLNTDVYLGSDFHGNNQIDAALNQVKIYSAMLTDTRVGEVISATQQSITKDYNSLKPLKSDSTTLMLMSLNDYPFTNSAPFYSMRTADKQHFQSSYAVNADFGQSMVITNIPLTLQNDGILDAKKESTIEFWISPFFDTANDPVIRTYFDAYGAVIEDAVSVNDVSVKISAPASKIISVKLQAGDPNIDYFAGGKLEIDTQRAIQETATIVNSNTVRVSKPILQVITVKIVGDPTGTDYFNGGAIGSDKQTIYLGSTLPSISNLQVLVTYQSTINGNTTLNTQVIRLNKKLPYQNTPVVVTYIPKGLQGDRVQLFKDRFGYMNFNITASSQDYTIKAPLYWSKNTWHRVRASYKVNGGLGTDEMRLFIDGYQWNDMPFNGKVFGPFSRITEVAFPGDGYSDGYNNLVLANIRFKDPINEVVIGNDYTGTTPIYALVQNLMISDQSRPVYAPYGEPIDVNYNSNLNVAFPATQDLYTTYLMDLSSTPTLDTDFATIKNRNVGQFDFTVTIIDSLDIVSGSSPLVKQNLENLINILKPANSRVFIEYTK